MDFYNNKTDEEKARWYSAGATFYAEGRPTYPVALTTAVAAVAGWREDSRILEIGSGPGTATQGFVGFGGEILCVEPNSEFVSLAQQAMSHFSNVAFQMSTSEEAQLAPPYDIILAASSFHWIDAGRGLKRMRDVLSPMGFVVLLWNKEPQPITTQADAVDEAFRRSGFTQQASRQSREETAKVFWDLSQPLQGAAFIERLYSHTLTSDDYSIDRFIALQRSLSPFLALPLQEQQKVAGKLT
ncbi:MAG TPA: class I SAM-dependent methyltransferase, partial [Nitrosospira sp.]|nr:class I SAM-dependent methyltransferase [Nitrosospira sp.]